jgi:transposase
MLLISIYKTLAGCFLYTDMRKSIDGLATIVQGQLSLDPYSKSLFMFCGKKCDRLKALSWEGDGFVILYKRLDNGKYRWPRNSMQAKELTSQQIRWLLDGLEIEQPKAIREGKHGDIY